MKWSERKRFVWKLTIDSVPFLKTKLIVIHFIIPEYACEDEDPVFGNLLPHRLLQGHNADTDDDEEVEGTTTSWSWRHYHVGRHSTTHNATRTQHARLEIFHKNLAHTKPQLYSCPKFDKDTLWLINEEKYFWRFWNREIYKVEIWSAVDFEPEINEF